MSLQDDLKSKEPIFGYDVNLKKAKKSELSDIYVASNFSKRNELRLASKTSKINLIELEQNSRQLGNICKKPFTVSVIGFK